MTDEAGPGEAYCRACGAVVDARADVCPSCGVRQRTGSALDDAIEGGNPVVAAALSAAFPGLGQLYNRELDRGIAIVVASVLAALSALVLVGFVLFPAVYVYAIYDAYRGAERFERERRADEG